MGQCWWYPRWRPFCRSFFFSSRRRHTRSLCDWSSDVCSSDLAIDAESAGTRGRRFLSRLACPRIQRQLRPPRAGLRIDSSRPCVAQVDDAALAACGCDEQSPGRQRQYRLESNRQCCSGPRPHRRGLTVGRCYRGNTRPSRFCSGRPFDIDRLPRVRDVDCRIRILVSGVRSGLSSRPMIDAEKHRPLRRQVEKLLARSGSQNSIYLALSLIARVLNAAGMFIALQRFAPSTFGEMSYLQATAVSTVAFCSFGIELSVNAQLTRKIKEGGPLAPTK